ncbi:MAG TPA: hypothetical protein ENK00_03575 [Chromatiales bacterium]|nr:hypothetical protein [Chromatiales bacterium]
MELRWILLLIGLVVLVAVYFHSTANRRTRGLLDREDDPDPLPKSLDLRADEQEVSVSELQDELINLDALLREEAAEQSGDGEGVAKVADTSAQVVPPQAGEEEMFVVLHVAAPSRDARLSGPEVLAALEACGLEHGALGIFHRRQEIGGSPRILFSVANMVKPGTLDPESLAAGEEIPGLSLFMRLPAFVPGEELYRSLLACTHELAQRLGGRILDEYRSALTQSAMEKMLEDIRLFELKRTKRREGSKR